MHISSESQYGGSDILTKCSKMTEETSHKRYGMNGSVESRIPKDEPTHKSAGGGSYGQGGRLKFFKDGKFILELERARDGERVSWVSVPRKTYWPPPGTATATPASYRQESSASLSVSDDNSSIQSSPWQRDHSWKQTTPIRNKSRGLSFVFWRPRKHRRLFKGRGVKRRRPHSSTVTDLGEDNSPPRAKGRTMRRRLLSIVAGLIEKNARTSTPPRAETVVSPRKRFLREMEKEKSQSSGVRSPGSTGERNSYVTEEPLVNSAQKRSRCRPSPTPAPSTPPSSMVKVEKMENSTPPPPSHHARPRSNGIEEGTAVKPIRNSSYSITSLLAEDSHHRSPSAKRSPSSSPSQFPQVTQVPPSVSSPSTRYCSPVSSTEDRMYSENVDRLRSIELSHAEKNIYPPYPPSHHYGAYMYPFPPVPPYYYARAPYMLPAMYHHGTTPVMPASVTERYHHPSGSHQPMSHPHHSPPVQPLALSVRRDSAPTCSWGGERNAGAGRDEVDHSADMPLNLSKHSG